MTTPATYIRDQILLRVQQLYTWGTIRKVPTITTQNDQFPRLGVYLVRETENPDGDANVGEPRYIDDVVIAISVMDALSNPDVLEGSVDTKIDVIKNHLLGDLTFVSLADENGNIFLDSIPTISRQYNFPNNGDTYYIECRLQMTCRFFVHYPPHVTNPFNEMAVTIEPNGDNAALPPQDTPFIIVIPQGEVTQPSSDALPSEGFDQQSEPFPVIF